MEIRTGNAQVGELTWQVEVSWQKRREILARRGIEYRGAGIVIHTEIIVEAIYPSCIQPAMPEDQFWALPLVHHEDLGTLVGYWLWTGRDMRADAGMDDSPEEAEEGNAGSA